MAAPLRRRCCSTVWTHLASDAAIRLSRGQPVFVLRSVWTQRITRAGAACSAFLLNGIRTSGRLSINSRLPLVNIVQLQMFYVSRLHPRLSTSPSLDLKYFISLLSVDGFDQSVWTIWNINLPLNLKKGNSWLRNMFLLFPAHFDSLRWPSILCFI